MRESSQPVWMALPTKSGACSHSANGCVQICSVVPLMHLHADPLSRQQKPDAYLSDSALGVCKCYWGSLAMPIGSISLR